MLMTEKAERTKNPRGRPKSGKLARQVSLTVATTEHIQAEQYPWEDFSTALERLLYKGLNQEKS